MLVCGTTNVPVWQANDSKFHSESCVLSHFIFNSYCIENWARFSHTHTQKKKCFKNLTTGLFTILPPFEIGNDCVTKWRVQEKSSAARATWRKAVGVWAAKQATYICHGRQLYLKELTDKPGLFRLQTLGLDRWVFVGFFFQLNEIRCHFKGNRRHYFFLLIIKFKASKK